MPEFTPAPAGSERSSTAAREAVPRARFSALLDCGDRPGAALAAIRAQTEAVIFTGGSDVARRLADIASQHGVRLVIERPAAALRSRRGFFRVGQPPAQQRCADFLAAPDAVDPAEFPRSRRRP